MKIFLSWSGDTSKAIAEILRNWLPSVIQATKPYFSPDDITKGTRWSNEIGKELEECKIGLLCLTPDNLEAPWVMFEAGVLSKSISSSRVCPLLFGIDPSDIKGPLVQFQAAPFTKEEVKKVVKMINLELGGAALAGDVLDSVFDMWWPQLEENVKSVMSKIAKSTPQKARSERDILDEILAMVRITPERTTIRETISHGAIQELMIGIRRLVTMIRCNSVEEEINRVESLRRLKEPLEYIARFTDEPDMVRVIFRDALDIDNFDPFAVQCITRKKVPQTAKVSDGVK